MECQAPAGASVGTQATIFESGDQRGWARRTSSTTIAELALLPSALAMPTIDLVRSPLVTHRTKAICFPSGDQSPSVTSSTSLRAAPPKDAIRYSEYLPW